MPQGQGVAGCGVLGGQPPIIPQKPPAGSFELGPLLPGSVIHPRGCLSQREEAEDDGTRAAGTVLVWLPRLWSASGRVPPPMPCVGLSVQHGANGEAGLVAAPSCTLPAHSQLP